MPLHSLSFISETHDYWPDEVTALVHVVEQPDSPVEIVAADFTDSLVTVAHERFTEQLRCTLKVRNGSDQ